MSGGIVQLVATGAQDTWLTGKPEVSFYRSSYKRYTHYSRSVERQLIQGTPTAGGISTIRFEKKGDLMNYVYFIAKDASGALIPGIDWSKVVDKVELLIGGQVVDTQDMVWSTQVEPVTGAQNYSQRYLNNNTTGLTNVINGFYPLKFFFCKDWNLSLPLVALQYHDIELRITWNANLNYRVGYEIYSTGSPASVPNINTVASTANPIIPSGFNAGLSAGTITVSSTNISTNSALQTTPFTYSAATFQLVPGMLLCVNNAGSAGSILGATNLKVLSVSPTSSISGTFIGAFSSIPNTSGALAATVLNPTAAAYFTATTTLLKTTFAGSFGAPAYISASAAPTVSGTVVTYGTVTQSGQGGYLTVGMSCTNIPGVTSASTIGYVSAVTISSSAGATGSITGFTLSLNGAAGSPTQPASTLATTLYFSAPSAAGQSVRITPNSTSGGASQVYNVTVFGTGATSTYLAGQIYVGMQVPALPTILTGAITAIGFITSVTSDSSTGLVSAFTVTYNTSVTPVSVSADITLLPPASATITSSAALTVVNTNSSHVGTVVVAGSGYAQGYLVPGMSVSGIADGTNGTYGTGYIYNINATTTPAAQGAQSAFEIYWPQTAPTTVAVLTNQLAYAANSTFSSVQKTVAGQTSISNVPIFGLGANGPTTTIIPMTIPVNSILTTGTAGLLTGESTIKTYVVSAITYLTPGVAYATLSFLAATAGGQALPTPIVNGNNLFVISVATTQAPVFTPSYPIVNVFAGAAIPNTVTSGQSVLGMRTSAFTTLRAIPTVANVYSGSIFSMATNIGTISDAAVSPTISNFDGYYNLTTVSFSFVPTSYYVGVISGNSTALSGSGTFQSSGTNTTSTDAISLTTLNGAASGSKVPNFGTYFYTTPSTTGVATVLGSPFVAVSGTDSTHIAVTYVAPAVTTPFTANSQFALVPQGQIQGTISIQPVEDRTGSAILSVTNLYSSSSTPLSVGLAVTGLTQYTGPVTVSQIVSGSVSSGSAVIEVSFPPQSAAPSTSTIGIQFIDPSVALNPGVTVSTTGFNGTYAQLQYEAWTNFVYLDQAERDYFANTPMDMLITQINRIPIASTNMQELALAHPIKFIAFLANNYTTAYQTQATTNIPASNYYYKQQINGVDVGDTRSLFQWQDVPQYYFTPFGYNHNGSVAPVSLISYCLDTSKLQPTGTLNFSRIDTFRIVAPVGVPLTQISGATNPYFYAMNYNVLRIKDGMAGLLYSN